jgi:succinate dehydrogenase / fumarate reductase iron-sulfur subunit
MTPRHITVRRFEVSPGAVPYWQTYVVDVRDNQTMLDALLIVTDRIDPTLAFRRTCRSGICGSCAAQVNGRSCLLCQMSIGEASSGRQDAVPIRVEPLPGFRVLRDLVVDMEPFFAAFDRAGAWLEPNPEYDGLLLPDVAGTLWPAMRCITCGICASGAERGPAALHPAAVRRVLALARDPRDAAGADRLRALDRQPDRRFAETLKAVCPKDVDVTGLVE